MPHGCVHRPRPPTTRLCPALRHAPIISTLLLCFYGFRRCCSTAPPLGTNLAPWARILLGFRCFASLPHGRVHRPCPPAMRLLCPALRHALIICTLLLCVYGFRRCCTAPPLGINLARLGLEFCWGSAVSQACLTDACLTDAFIGHVHLLDMSSYPPWAYISMLLSMLLLCFYGFRRCWPPLGMNLLFRKHAPRMRSSAMSTCHAPMSSSPPCAYQRHAFALCLRVSKMLYGTASQDQFGMPWARILLGFRCFATNNAEMLPTKRIRRTMSLNELPKPLRPKPLADRLRNSRTAAGFVSKPCEPATTNNAEILLTKRIRS